MPANRDDTLALAAAGAIMLGTIAASALLPGVDRGPPSTASLADRDPACAEWTDGCITCQRTPQGPACSTPGIACTREAARCVRRDGS